VNKDWTIREYREGDESAILDLFKTVFKSEMSLEHWKWEYLDNPAGQPIISVAEAKGRIVGHNAQLIRKLKVGDQIISGVLGVDVMVHPEYRRQRMHVTMNEASLEMAAKRGVQIAYVFANRLSQLVVPDFCDYNCIYPDGIPLWVKPLKVKNIIKTHVVSNNILASILSFPSWLGVQLLCRESKINIPWEITPMKTFDDRADVLWNEFSKSQNILVVRDRKYCTWRYLQGPEKNYQIYSIQKDGQLLGYTVIKCVDLLGLKIGFIVDLITMPQIPTLAEALISSAVDYFRSAQMDIAGCMMLPQAIYAPALRKRGFIRVPKRFMPEEMYLDINIQHAQQPRSFLLDPKNWYITWSDHDVI
jgi:hypothetical protein